MKNLKQKVFLLTERLTGYKAEKNRFKEKQGYGLDLEQPSSFNQKVVWKKIYDRNPFLTITSDKYEVRDYLEKVLAETRAKDVLIPVLHVTDRPEDIPFKALPDQYIIKATHASGKNFIVRDRKTINEGKVIKICKEWLREPFGILKHEWAYRDIKPRIIIEKLILDEEGSIPRDFKFYVFHGSCKMVHVDFDRFADRSRSLFTPTWDFIPATLKFPQGPAIERPAGFEEMVQLAESLGRDFDFVRVDLYNVGDRVYFGELTHYPGSGMERFTPRLLDFELGRHWRINNIKN